MTAAAVFGLPEAPTALGVVAILIVVGYLLLRSYSATLRTEVDGLRLAMDRQSERHRLDVVALNTKIDKLDGQYDEQRTAKHKAVNELSRARLALDIVHRLQAECTCGALNPLADILNNMAQNGEI